MIGVYAVMDTSSNEIISIHKSKAGAYAAVLDYLEDANYTAEEWEEFAEDNGYSSVEDFKAMLRQVPDYYSDFDMEVIEQVLLP